MPNSACAACDIQPGAAGCMIVNATSAINAGSEAQKPPRSSPDPHGCGFREVD
jgi:hypothetical protein